MVAPAENRIRLERVTDRSVADTVGSRARGAFEQFSFPALRGGDARRARADRGALEVRVEQRRVPGRSAHRTAHRGLVVRRFVVRNVVYLVIREERVLLRSTAPRKVFARRGRSLPFAGDGGGRHASRGRSRRSRRRAVAVNRVCGPEVAEVAERPVALLRELAAESLEDVAVLRGEPVGHFGERRFVLRRGGRERAHIHAERVELAVEVDRRPNTLIGARSVPVDVAVRSARRRVGPRGVGARRSRGDDAGRRGDQGAELGERERELGVADATALVAHGIVCVGVSVFRVRSPSRWRRLRMRVSSPVSPRGRCVSGFAKSDARPRKAETVRKMSGRRIAKRGRTEEQRVVERARAGAYHAAREFYTRAHSSRARRCVRRPRTKTEAADENGSGKKRFLFSGRRTNERVRVRSG